MKILVPVESKRMAQAQVEYIINHKWDADLSLHVLYAVEPVIDDDGEDKGLQSQMYEWSKSRGLSLVTDIANQLRSAFHQADILETVEADHASELILDVAEEWQADVIVMGAHGKRLNQRMTAGSVSTTVLGYADCAVVVVRPAKRDKNYQPSESKSSTAIVSNATAG